MLELVERHSTGKARLLRLLQDIAAEGWCDQTLYLTPDSIAQRKAANTAIQRQQPHADNALATVLQTVGNSDTGIALFLGQGRAVAICPPFPLRKDARSHGADSTPLAQLLHDNPLIGIVLLRLGRYAIGILRGDALIASKTSARYMKNRHRAGGQSQRRFQRSRERLIRELYDKTCQTANALFAPHANDLDYILLGGEKSTLDGFTQRCPLIQNLSDKTLDRRLSIDQPNHKTITNIVFEAWKSRVYDFHTIPPQPSATPPP